MKPLECSGCELECIGGKFVQIEGTGSNGVLILADAPGEQEDRDGLPLRPYAPAGSVFQGILRRMSGVDRSQFTLSNTIRCRPPKNFLQGAPMKLPRLSTVKYIPPTSSNNEGPEQLLLWEQSLPELSLDSPGRSRGLNSSGDSYLSPTVPSTSLTDDPSR